MTVRNRLTILTHSQNLNDSPTGTHHFNSFAVSEAMYALLLASADADVGKRAKEIAIHYANHILLLAVSNPSHVVKTLVESMCRALVVALCHEIESVACCGREVLKELIRLIRAIEGPEHVVFTKLCDELDLQCRTCKWRGQNGAISAFDILVKGLSLDWVVSQQVQMCNSLLYIVKGQLPEVMNRVADDVKSCLQTLLQCCYKDNASDDSMMDVDEDEEEEQDDDEEETTSKKKGRKSTKRKKTKTKKQPKKRRKVVEKEEEKSSVSTTRVVEILATELSSRHAKVREIARDALCEMAKLLHHDNVSSLLEPNCEELRSYIFSRQFRVHPIDVQIGQIEALAYGLSLSPPIFTDREKLLKLLKNALKLTETHDPEKDSSKSTKSSSSSSSGSTSSPRPPSSSSGSKSSGGSTRRKSSYVFLFSLSLSYAQTHTNTKQILHDEITSTVPVLHHSRRTTTRSCSEIRG